MSVAFVYLTILLIQLCKKKSRRDDRNSELSESFVSESNSYYNDDDYTNSQYLRSDD
jgi:hypothetical protein